MGICLLAVDVICCVQFSARVLISFGVSWCVGGGELFKSSSEYLIQLAFEYCLRGFIGIMMGYADIVAMMGRWSDEFGGP